MTGPRVLFISGSLGLGHAARDLAIARQIRLRVPAADISWLAVHPASAALEQGGEVLLPEAAELANENASAERSSSLGGLNVLGYLLRSRKVWRRNVEVFTRVVESRPFDLVIGDETYEISLALRDRPTLKNWPFVMIFDFVGLEPMTGSPVERLGVYVWNRKWCHDYRKRRRPPYDLGLFVGEREDVPDRPFGFLLPNRRDFATAMYRFVGHAFPFDPQAFSDRVELRRRLGYGPDPLVVAAIGGTAIGRELLELCGAAFSELRMRTPSIQTVLVTGPRLAAETLNVPSGIDVRPFVPDLYQHFAACDVAIVQGGATSTMELAALRRPFIYFPLPGHSEQAGVARNLRRRGAGVEMHRAETTPTALADRIAGLLGREADWPAIPSDGARRAADLIVSLLDRTRVEDRPPAGRGR